MRRLLPFLVAVLTLTGLATGGVAGSAATLYWVKMQPSPVQQTVKSSPIIVREVGASSTESSISAIFRAVGPAVVSVTAGNRTRGSSGQEESGGTGFIVSEQGHVFTNNHVVQGANRISVILMDGSRYEAKVVGTDPTSDLALLQADIPSDKLVIAALGDSDQVEPGELAIAIGSPFGLDHTVTSGIISAVGREFGSAGGRPMRGLIQTDAPINPGNSGGPLLNGKGEVIGINTSIDSPVRGSVGIGFAIPSNRAKQLMPDLAKGKSVEHPWLGIEGGAITADIAQTNKLPVESGVLVAKVIADGPASKAGLKGGDPNSSDTPVGGDIITEVDGKAVKTVPELSVYLDTKRVGDSVTLTVIRDGKTIKVKVTLEAWPVSESG